MDLLQIKQELAASAEDSYAAFIAKLVPNAVDPIIGVRIPLLRKMAKAIATEDWRGFVTLADHSSHEMNLLHGLVLGQVKADFAEILPAIDSFIDHINNWAVCDSFCASLKITAKHKEEMWRFLLACLQTEQIYRIRFAVVMMMDYFLDEQYLPKALALFDQLKNEDYYVKMAVAWAVSMYYVHLPEQTLPFLRHNQLDNFTHNKAIQKIRESRIPSDEAKQMLNSLKRK